MHLVFSMVFGNHFHSSSSLGKDEVLFCQELNTCKTAHLPELYPPIKTIPLLNQQNYPILSRPFVSSQDPTRYRDDIIDHRKALEEASLLVSLQIVSDIPST